MSLKNLVGGALLGGGALYFAQHYHIVHHAEGLEVVARTQQPNLSTTYLDVRGWSAPQWADYPDVAEALVKAERTELMFGGAGHDTLNNTAQPFGAPPAGGTSPQGPSLTPRPQIQFDSALSTSAANVPHSGAAQLAAEDDSLIGRLSRQLEQQRTAPAGAPQSQPLNHSVGQPPAAGTTQPSWIAPPVTDNTRAAVEPPPANDWSNSIQSTGLERITGEPITSGTGAAESPATIAARQTVDFFSTLESRLPLDSSAAPAADAGATYSPVQSITQSLAGEIERSVLPAREPTSAAATSIPFDSTNLGGQIPSALQEQFRSLAPLDTPADIPTWLEPL